MASVQAKWSADEAVIPHRVMILGEVAGGGGGGEKKGVGSYVWQGCAVARVGCLSDNEWCVLDCCTGGSVCLRCPPAPSPSLYPLPLLSLSPLCPLLPLPPFVYEEIGSGWLGWAGWEEEGRGAGCKDSGYYIYLIYCQEKKIKL